MEYRKLISFGKSSYVVSLPKAWVIKQKLKKGDVIYFDEKDNNLILQPKENENKDEEKEIKIDVDGKEIKRVQRELISAYIKNYKIIIFYGKSLKDKAKNIQEVIQNLIALEVMEQTADKLIAKDFLNFEKISIADLVRKMDITTRAMLSDSIKTFEEDSYNSIFHRDQDVNRMAFLLFRIVRYGLENPLKAEKQLNTNPVDLLNLWWLAFNLEGIADETKRIARYMRRIKLDKANKKKFEGLYQKIEFSYLEILKAYYLKNIETAHKIIQDKEELMKECDSFYEKNSKVVWTAHLIDRIKSLLTYAHNIGRIVYQQ